jgi:short-subunit dehydrogenase
MSGIRRLTHGKTALITGASSGIGRELTKLFARDGYNLVLIARRAPQLVQFAEELTAEFGISVKVIAEDLSVPHSPDDIFSVLQQESITIDVLVNNAGFGVYGAFTATDLRKELELLQVNIVSLTHLTKLFLQDMIKKGEGRILNVASTGAFEPGPFMSIYYASKAYVLAFSEGLAHELRGSGVTVTVLCPGPTRTGFQQRAGIEKLRILGNGVVIMNAKAVAFKGYRGLMANKIVVIPGLINKLLAIGVKILPRRWSTHIVGNIQKE